ncbi:ISAs1 family transposase [Moorena sp. SIOASIH]|uniref:ISAs1 family transposase n=1 Tax=Moorena sp. SIOASIH TaxID=2607817 RepID=UPI0025E43CA3|nr:ISAs1 family transposase [Moorena sp. SIOASIH]
MAKGFGRPVPNTHNEREAQILKKSVLNHFEHRSVPRVGSRTDHNFVAIVTIAILAVIAGADGFVAIETYGKAKQKWLETFLDLPHGIPSHDTFGRVFGQLAPQQLEAGFLSWVGSITESLDIELIHIDGKTAKGSYDRKNYHLALHSVSAWSSEYGLVLAQQKVESKSNEITAVPLLLKLLNLFGAVVTLDAMGTQIDIARQILQAGGDYVLALKGNQGKLSQQVGGWFAIAQAMNWQGIELSDHQTVEASHHRKETRQVWAVGVSQLPPLLDRAQWEGLTSVVMVKRTRQLWNMRHHPDSVLPQFPVGGWLAAQPGDSLPLGC